MKGDESTNEPTRPTKPLNGVAPIQMGLGRKILLNQFIETV